MEPIPSPTGRKQSEAKSARPLTGVPDGTRPWRTSRTGVSPGTSLRGVQLPGTRRMACHVQYLARVTEGIYRSRISSAASASCEYRSDPSRADDAKAPHAGRARGVYPPQGRCRTSVRADQTRARLAALQSPWRRCCLRPRRPNPAWNHRDTGADEASTITGTGITAIVRSRTSSSAKNAGT